MDQPELSLKRNRESSRQAHIAHPHRRARFNEWKNDKEGYMACGGARRIVNFVTINASSRACVGIHEYHRNSVNLRRKKQRMAEKKIYDENMLFIL